MKQPDADGVIRVTMDDILDGFVEDTFLIQPDLLETATLTMEGDERVEYIAMAVSSEWDLWDGYEAVDDKTARMKLDPKVVEAVQRYLAKHEEEHDDA